MTNGTKETKEITNGIATSDQISAWKKMWGNVNEIKVADHYCYLRPFDRATLKLALSQMTVKINTETQEAEMDMGKIIELGEIALQNCWIGGSEEINDNDTLWIAAAMQAGQLFELVETQLKKY